MLEGGIYEVGDGVRVFSTDCTFIRDLYARHSPNLNRAIDGNSTVSFIYLPFWHGDFGTFRSI